MSNYAEAKLAAQIYISLLTEQRERRQLHHDETPADDDTNHIDLVELIRNNKHDR